MCKGHDENGVCFQEMVSESTTKTVLSNLQPNTRYSVTVVPVYAEGDGPSLSDSGRTSEYWSEQLEGEQETPTRRYTSDVFIVLSALWR